ncbi:MAG: GH3 auxin-responsive promoter family protein [Gordonia sp. (in: high G+C Gram-positive bacteria)]
MLYGNTSTYRDPDVFRSRVPVRDYTDFADHVSAIRAGATAVLTQETPYAFLQTSGSTAEPKLIPTTRHWRKQYRGPGLYSQWGLYYERFLRDEASGNAGAGPAEPVRRASLAGSIVDMSWSRTQLSPVPPGDRRFPQYSISARPASVGGTDWIPPWYDDEWFHPSGGSAEFIARLPRLNNESVRGLVTLNPSRVVALDRAVRERGEWLVSHITDHGRASSDYLNGLRQAVEHCDGLGLRQVWPRLELLVAWNSASAALYRSAIEGLLPGVDRLPFSTTGTEGIVTTPVDAHQSAGPLAIDQGFYEFLPWNDHNDGRKVQAFPATLLADELVKGQTYRLVMSQGNGLLRYDVGDLYTVLGHVGQSPRLEFVGRAGAGHSFTGEKLTETQVYGAVRASLHAELRRDSAAIFTVSPVWSDPPHYTAIIEAADPAEAAPSVGRIAARIDDELAKQNIEYGEKRASGRLGHPRALLVAPGTLHTAAAALARPGTSVAQIKHFWIQRDSKLLTRLQETAVDVSRLR